MLRRTLIIWLIVGCAAVSLIAGGAWKNVDTKTIYMNINDAGDTAQVVKFHDFVAKDSFPYIDTIGPTSTKIVVTWTSPVQKMAITIDADSIIDSGVYYDTVIMPGTTRDGIKWVAPLYEIGITPTTALDLNTYACTVNFAGDTLFAEWTAPSSGTTIAMVADSMVLAINAKVNLTDSVLAVDGTTFYSVRSMFSGYSLARFTVTCDSTADLPADTANIAANSVAMFCDSVAQLINDEAVLTDTVTAHDSATYVLVFSNFSHNNLGGRWTIKQTGTADNNGQDTATGGRIATILMVIDSMVAAINGTVTLTDTVTAANDGDTVYTLTTDMKGWATYVNVGDTAQDTTLITANATSNSVGTGTIDIGRTIWSDGHATSIRGRFILEASDSTGLGIGLSDSGYIWLNYLTTYGDSTLVDSAFRAALPCTLSVSVADAIGNNVVFGDKLTLSWRVSDTSSDTSALTIPFDITYDYTLKD